MPRMYIPFLLCTTCFAQQVSLLTVSGSGSGRALVRNYVSASQYDLNRFTTGSYDSGETYSPAHPGQTLIAWGSGLNGAAGVRVLVDNLSIVPLYAGPSPGAAGIDQLNFQLPEDLKASCTVPLQISAGRSKSNIATIAVAAPESDACVHPSLPPAVLQKLDRGDSVTLGTILFGAIRLESDWDNFWYTFLTPFPPTELSWAGGEFGTYSADSLENIPALIVDTDTCRWFTRGENWYRPRIDLSPALLDAGPEMYFTPMSWEMRDRGRGQYVYEGGVYSNYLAGQMWIVSQSLPLRLDVPGGSGISAFQATFRLDDLIASPPDYPLDKPRHIHRAEGETIRWTPNRNGLISIIGFDPGSTNGRNTFLCTTASDRGSFWIPPAILEQFPQGGSGRLYLLSVKQVTDELSAPVPSGSRTAPLSIVGSAGWVWSAVFE